MLRKPMFIFQLVTEKYEGKSNRVSYGLDFLSNYLIFIEEEK